MEHDRDLEKEEMLGDIIRDGGDDSPSQFLNNSDGEGREDEGSASVGALTVAKSGDVYILIKPLLTRCINCFVCTYINASFSF